MRRYFALTLCASLITSTSFAQMGRHGGGGARPEVQNRSTGQSVNRSANTGQNINNTNVNRNVNNANVNTNYNNVNVNRNANVNQNVNVNRNVNVNQNVNVNRNVNVSGGCYNCGYNDNSWNWGSFAAGAAVGVATTAAVAAATRPPTQTVVVAAPAVGTMVQTLPGGCGTVSAGGAVIYSCNNVYYRPYYQGTTLVYQVVTYP